MSCTASTPHPHYLFKPVGEVPLHGGGAGSPNPHTIDRHDEVPGRESTWSPLVHISTIVDKPLFLDYGCVSVISEALIAGVWPVSGPVPTTPMWTPVLRHMTNLWETRAGGGTVCIWGMSVDVSKVKIPHIGGRRHGQRRGGATQALLARAVRPTV